MTISAYEDDAYAASWQLKGYLVCADPIAGQQVIREDPYPDSWWLTSQVLCT